MIRQAESLLVTETFVSLQGEGAHMGWPCFFVRLTGCNLRCSYCDTRYAYHGGERRGISSLVEEWRKSRIPLVQVTGGEPLLQPGSVALMERLLEAGARVLLETNGSLSLERVPRRVIKVVDRKTPGSGMEAHWLVDNIRSLAGGDQIKYVIVSREDYEWARNEVLTHHLASCCEILFSPAQGAVAPAALGDWILDERLPVRLQIQLHKHLWNGDKDRLTHAENSEHDC